MIRCERDKSAQAMEFSVSVFLTSDEKYLAPFDWVDDVDLYLRNCWHPGALPIPYIRLD